MKKRWIVFGCMILLSYPLVGEDKKVFNPITDVCWSCIFPIHLGGVNTTPGHKDLTSYAIKPLCACSGTPPRAGAPLAFWEPVALIEVTRTPYKSLVLGGVSLENSDLKKKGAVSAVGLSGQHSFYNVHYYKAPLLAWLDLFPYFSCIDVKGEIDMSYLSELDPSWNDDEWSSILSPEGALFANPLAQTACISDCASTALNKPADSLFWCAGCVGSLYPFSGHVPHHVGAIQASYLIVQRLLAKLHAAGSMMGFKDEEFCHKTIMLRLKKTMYKTQLVFPVANTSGPCQPLGKSDILWGSGKTYPYGGEDFVYLIWKKNHCCLDAVKPTLHLTGIASP